MINRTMFDLSIIFPSIAIPERYIQIHRRILGFGGKRGICHLSCHLKHLRSHNIEVYAPHRLGRMATVPILQTCCSSGADYWTHRCTIDIPLLWSEKLEGNLLGQLQRILNTLIQNASSYLLSRKTPHRSRKMSMSKAKTDCSQPHRL